MPEILLDNVSAHYQHRKVLGPLSLRLPANQITVFIGKSGSGKSTLLKKIYQLYRDKIDIALIPQDLGLVANLSSYHNVYMGQLARQSSWYNLTNLIRPRKSDLKNVTELMAQLGLDNKHRQAAGELSGGQQQRLAVARALHQQAQLLIADEPISALDAPKAQQVMSTLCQHYSSALISLHDIDLALQYGQRIIGIKEGRIALDQAADELSPQDLLEFY